MLENIFKVGNKLPGNFCSFLGWPNAPKIPVLSTEGRILYVNWKNPVYLGGLNSSLIDYEICKRDKALYHIHTNIYKDEKYNCSSAHNQCFKMVKYRDLRNGDTEYYYVYLKVKESVNMMCQGYNTPRIIKSKKSSINLQLIVGE